MNSILVIGGGGFLGKKLLVELLNKGCQNLYCLDLINPNIKGVHFFECNLLIENILSRFYNLNPSLIINLTGQVSDRSNICFSLNTRGLDSIIRLVESTKSFLVQISTVGVFGTTRVAAEESELSPETVYSACKAFAEHTIQSRLKTNQFAIIRLSNLYGYDQEKGIMAYLRRSFLSDRKLYFNNDGSLKRAYLNVEDCAYSLANVLLHKKDMLEGSYNFVGNEIFTIKELVRKFEDLSQVKFQVSFEDRLPYDNPEILKSNRWEVLSDHIPEHSVADFFKRIVL